MKNFTPHHLNEAGNKLNQSEENHDITEIIEINEKCLPEDYWEIQGKLQGFSSRIRIGKRIFTILILILCMASVSMFIIDWETILLAMIE